MTTALPKADERVQPSEQRAVPALEVGDYPAIIARVRKQVTRDPQTWREAKAEGREPYPYFRVTFRIDGGDQGAKTMHRNFSLSPQAWPITSGLLMAALDVTEEDLALMDTIDEQSMVGEEVGVHLEEAYNSRIPDNFLQSVFPVSEVGEHETSEDNDQPELT